MQNEAREYITFFNDNVNGRPYKLGLVVYAVAEQLATAYSPYYPKEFMIERAVLVRGKSHVILHPAKHRFITEHTEEIEAAFLEDQESHSEQFEEIHSLPVGWRKCDARKEVV